VTPLEFATQVVKPADVGASTPEKARALNTAIQVKPGTEVVDVLHVTVDAESDNPMPKLDTTELYWDVYWMPVTDGMPSPKKDAFGDFVYTNVVCSEEYLVETTAHQPLTGVGKYTSPEVTTPNGNGILYFQEMIIDTDIEVGDGEPAIMWSGKCGLARESVRVEIVPKINIEKYSTNEGWGPNNTKGDHDTKATSKSLKVDTDEKITFTITNNGDESLVMIEVTDKLTDGVNAITDISCDFTGAVDPDRKNPVFPNMTPVGLEDWVPYSTDTIPADSEVPTEGTGWNGPFVVGASFDCSARLPGLPMGAIHADQVTVVGLGQFSGKRVTDKDTWWGHVPTPLSLPTGGTVINTSRWSLVAAGLLTLAGVSSVGFMMVSRRRL
jgi:hypothetical protein